MSALDRKLWGDLWRMKGQWIAISLVMAAGVATFIMSRSTQYSLERTLADYYNSHQFADVFAHVKRAPRSLAERIREIPGVASVQARVVVDVTLDVAGLREPALGHLVSIGSRDWTLNRIYLRRGRLVEPERTGEVLVGESFAEAHRLEPGAQLRAVINGRLQTLTVVGVALSPEFIYQIRPGDVLPDDKRYGVFWMNESDLASAFDMRNACNDFCLALAPRASAAQVMSDLDRLTKRYGSLGSYAREDQPSHKFVHNELRELRGMALVVPTIFLAVAAVLLNVVITRLIHAQREQIATLKAFGYRGREIGWHYLKLVLILVGWSVALGTAIGFQLGRNTTHMYTHFFRFPEFRFFLAPGVVLFSAGVNLAAALVGTWRAVRRATSLPPAEAMRPEAPAFFRPTILARLGLERWFSPAARTVLRRLEQQPAKAFMSCLGIAAAVAVLILGNFIVDAIDHAIETQFEVAQRHDVGVSFIEPTSPQAIHELARLPGVHRCQPYRALPARIRVGHRSRRTSVLAIDPADKLYRLVDIDCHVAPLPEEGLVISAKLAEVLGIGLGDAVTLEVLEGRQPILQPRVTALVRDFSGIAVYMRLSSANRLMREGPMVSGAFLSADTAALDDLYVALRNSPRVSSVTIKGVTLRSFRQTIAENLLTMHAFTIGFAGVIAVGVVYNTTRIALTERARDLATLRVLGFTRVEVAVILLGELALLTAIALPLGMLLGYGLAAFVIELSYDTELFRIPLVISRGTYAFAALVTLMAVTASSWIVRRMLDRLDLLAVLKAPE